MCPIAAMMRSMDIREQQRQQHVRYRRLGRKMLASGRMAQTIEKRLGVAPATRKRRIKLPKINYQFRRWHAFVLLTVVALAIIGTFVSHQLRQQELARKEAAQAKAQQAAVEKLKVRQACLADVASKKHDQLGKVTYDQLYDGLCN